MVAVTVGVVLLVLSLTPIVMGVTLLLRGGTVVANGGITTSLVHVLMGIRAILLGLRLMCGIIIAATDDDLAMAGDTARNAAKPNASAVRIVVSFNNWALIGRSADSAQRCLTLRRLLQCVASLCSSAQFGRGAVRFPGQALRSPRDVCALFLAGTWHGPISRDRVVANTVDPIVRGAYLQLRVFRI